MKFIESSISPKSEVGHLLRFDSTSLGRLLQFRTGVFCRDLTPRHDLGVLLMTGSSVLNIELSCRRNQPATEVSVPPL